MRDKGFTLVEVLVVLAIIAVLLSLSIQGITQFRAASEVKEAGRQLTGTLDLIKNAAKNDVRQDIGINSFNFKGYKYLFKEKRLEWCEDIYLAQTLQQEWVCRYEEAVEKNFFNLVFPVNLDRGDDYSNPAAFGECNSVYIESLTGDILIQIGTTGLSTAQTTGKCIVPFTDFGKNITAYLVVDGLTDTYRIYGDLNDVR